MLDLCLFPFLGGVVNSPFSFFSQDVLQVADFTGLTCYVYD